ncbi:MAG: hypothetical protein ACKO0Y_05770, partial [Bacteroidota bacterium]
MNVLNIIPYFLIWLFAIGFSMNTLHSEVYEGWLDPDSTGPITPIWMEIHETVAGVYSGWYVNR